MEGPVHPSAGSSFRHAARVGLSSIAGLSEVTSNTRLSPACLCASLHDGPLHLAPVRVSAPRSGARLCTSLQRPPAVSSQASPAASLSPAPSGSLHDRPSHVRCVFPCPGPLSSNQTAAFLSVSLHAAWLMGNTCAAAVGVSRCEW